jgi:predicted DsbA family dithiol-disulfide isomerase
MSRAVVELELFLDMSCPWCHGSIESTRRILDELAADPELPALRLQWRFMRLHPMPRPGGLSLDEYYASWGDGSPEALERAREGVREYVRSVGTRVDFSRYTFVHDPLLAHRVLAAVRDDAGDDLPSLWSLARAISSAGFVGGVDISDHAALRGAVERAGLVLPLRVWEAVEASGDITEAELPDRLRALEVELDGVPRIVVGGTIVPAWIDLDDVRARLRSAITAAAATPA